VEEPLIRFRVYFKKEVIGALGLKEGPLLE
jgi:hypothetical protein